MSPIERFWRKCFPQKKKMELNAPDFWKLEEAFDIDSFDKFIRTNPYLPLYLCFCYLVCCYIGSKYMRNRKPWEMKQVLVSWNLVFALFSLCGTLRVMPLTLQVLTHSGIEGLVYHDPELTYRHKVLGLWTQLFIFSKVFELFDTFFLILRKEELSFIHRYHHITVLVYSWHAYTTDSGVSVFFIMLNYGVHTLMYLYYFLQNFLTEQGTRWLPGWVLTTSQICQMFLGMSLCITSAILQYDNWVFLLRILDLINVLKQFHLLHPSKIRVLLEWGEKLKILPPLELAKLAVSIYLTVSYIVLWMMLWQKGCYLVESCFYDEKALIDDANEAEQPSDFKKFKVLVFSGSNTLRGQRVVYAWTPERGSKQWARSMRRVSIPEEGLRKVFSAPNLEHATVPRFEFPITRLSRGLSSPMLYLAARIRTRSGQCSTLGDDVPKDRENSGQRNPLSSFDDDGIITTSNVEDTAGKVRTGSRSQQLLWSAL